MNKTCLLVTGLLLLLSGVAYSLNLGDGYMGCSAPKKKKPNLSPALKSFSAAESPAPNGWWLDGIDISGHQSVTNWSQLKAAKDYVMMKATEGYGYTDSAFSSCRSGTRSNGIMRGFYHYARPDLGNSATTEANWFVSQVTPLQNGECLMLDFEILSQNWSGGDGPGWCKTFLDRCYALTGVKPVIYLYWPNPGTGDRNWSAIVNAGYGLWLGGDDGNADPTVGVGGTAWSFVPNKQVLVVRHLPGRKRG